MSTHRIRRIAHGTTVATPRRPTSVANDGTPGWLRSAAGWSWRLIVVTAAVLLIVLAVLRLQLLFVALFIALIVTSILRPVVDWLSRYVPRPLATVLAFLGGFLTVSGIIAFVVLSISGQWGNLSDQFVNGIGQLQNWIEGLKLPFLPADQSLTDWVNSQLGDLASWVEDNAGVIAGGFVSSVGAVAVVATTLVIALICSIFFVNSGHVMWRWTVNQFPKRSRERLQLGGSTAWEAFSGYTRGIVLLAASNAVLAGTVIAFMRVPLALPLAVLVFFGTFIPIVGAPLAMMIAAVVALAAHGPFAALIVMIGIALMGQVTSQILEPLIMSRSVNLHPIVVIVGVTGGTLLIGVLGAVIATPVIAVVWQVFAALRPQLDEPEDGSDDAPRTSRFRIRRARAAT